MGSRYIDGVSTPWIARRGRELAPVWERLLDGRRGYLAAVAVGEAGDVFVAGNVEAPPLGEATEFPNYDIWIARIAG